MLCMKMNKLALVNEITEGTMASYKLRTDTLNTNPHRYEQYIQIWMEDSHHLGLGTKLKINSQRDVPTLHG